MSEHWKHHLVSWSSSQWNPKKLSTNTSSWLTTCHLNGATNKFQSIWNSTLSFRDYKWWKGRTQGRKGTGLFTLRVSCRWIKRLVWERCKWWAGRANLKKDSWLGRSGCIQRQRLRKTWLSSPTRILSRS
jgi:hypothetical protein